MIGTLYCDDGCPFAHRIRAFLTLRGIDHRALIAPAGMKPVGLAAYSPTERIPFWVDDNVAIGESRVIVDYLAEGNSYDAAYPADTAGRALHRHAIALVDDYFTPRLMAPSRPYSGERLAEVIATFESVLTPLSAPSLFALHIAPIWLRMRWGGPTDATRLVESRPELRSWLDTAADLDCVVRTMPDRAVWAAHVEP